MDFTDFIFWINMVIFLLLPYYLRIFMLDFRKTRWHIVFWLGVHLGMTVISYLYLNEWWSWPLLLLFLCGGYFICSYIFYVRDKKSFEGLDSIEYLVQSKLFIFFKRAVLILGVILLIAYGVFIIGDAEEIVFNKVYLFGVFAISYVQIILYLKEYKKIY